MVLNAEDTIVSPSLRALERAKEYCALSNQIGALPNDEEGKKNKKALLDSRFYPMYDQEVDMFGLVGKKPVVAAVEFFFLESYPDSLRYDTALNGNAFVDESFGGAHELHVRFVFARYWRDGDKWLVSRGAESIDFVEKDGHLLASKFTYIPHSFSNGVPQLQPTKPAELLAAPAECHAEILPEQKCRKLENHQDARKDAATKAKLGAYALYVVAQFPDTDNRDKWLGAVNRLASHAEEHEPDTLSFYVAFDEQDSLKLHLTERYTDKAAFVAHKGTDAFKHFLAELEGIKRTVQASYNIENPSFGFQRM